jgi:cytochrome c peroxidase
MYLKFYIFLIGCLLLQLTNLQASIFEPTFRETKLKSLKSVPVPGPSDLALSHLIKNKKAAIQLGKALFWDTRVGSGNKTSCASCHFHAGVDNRVKNQLQPGLLSGDTTFQLGGINYQLSRKNFPFITKDDDKGAEDDINEVVGSQGVFNAIFEDAYRENGKEECKYEADAIFHGLDEDGKHINTRRAEQRHTPSTINAVFNFRNFWDGRATNMFNGVDPFGRKNAESYIWKLKNGKLEKVVMDLQTSALASQASGPPLSGFEMSCKERQFHHIAKKLLYGAILKDQKIAKTDSVLGEFALKKPTYQALIQEAFRPEWWDTTEAVPYAGAPRGSMDLKDAPNLAKNMNEAGITMMEANFTMFFGLAIQMYESTLISDDSPFDRFAEGDQNALTDAQKRGLAVFQGQGQCIKCHTGAEFTSASFSSVNQQRLINFEVTPDKHFIADNGFFNIGVRPMTDDPGIGGVDPFGKPMSETRMYMNGWWDLLGNNFDPSKYPKPSDIKKTSIEGAFKVPSLRNVELTGPYFHNGGKSTLLQVIELYDAGGDFIEENSEGLGIVPVNLSAEQEQDLIHFLLSLTDDRVRYKRAPFDHPSLCFTNGHQGATNEVTENGRTGNATDELRCLPAVGAEGTRVALKPFLGLSPFQR